MDHRAAGYPAGRTRFAKTPDGPKDDRSKTPPDGSGDDRSKTNVGGPKTTATAEGDPP
jgi:hypothetical protein